MAEPQDVAMADAPDAVSCPPSVVHGSSVADAAFSCSYLSSVSLSFSLGAYQSRHGRTRDETQRPAL
jgi:hypothetical protein